MAAKRRRNGGSKNPGGRPRFGEEVMRRATISMAPTTYDKLTKAAKDSGVTFSAYCTARLEFVLEGAEELSIQEIEQFAAVRGFAVQVARKERA